jgi:adenylylsulfate kinase
MGLPGSGKTTLAKELVKKLEAGGTTVAWLNADSVRRYYDDWDFSVEGRLRQSLRMRELADLMQVQYVICDFVCPLPEMRENFDADWCIWMDTILEGRYADTNALFVPPAQHDFKFVTQDAVKQSEILATAILAKYSHVDPYLSTR